MDLQTLSFKVETGPLKEAVVAINELGQALSKVNAPVKAVTKETEGSTKATKENTTVLQRQQDILKFMADGYSKGQASVLAYAKASGALTTEIESLGVVLQKQRTLMGTDPFDKSLGALTALKNEYGVIKEVQRLYNAELGLSRSQMEQLARDKIRLIAQYKIEGRSLTDIKSGLISLNTAYLSNVQAEQRIIDGMKAKDKAASDTAKANAYLEKEMQRVNLATGDNAALTSTTNNALIRFESALKRSGMTAKEQSVALDTYREKLLSIQKAGGNRQVDYLSRAIGPQITDIVTGLATGQAPMTVLLQQGGQLRDQFALAGVAGKDMGNMLKESAKSMVGSVKDVAMAVGGLIVSLAAAPFVSFYNVIKTAVTALQASAAATLALESGLISAARATRLKELALGRLLQAAAAFSTVIATAAAIVGGVFAMAFYQANKEIDDLSKQLIVSGATMGLTKKAALDYINGLKDLGVSTSTGIAVMTEMAKAGGFTAEQFDTVAVAASNMERYVGISVEETVKAMKKLKEDPVKALAELGTANGNISKEILNSVIAFEQQGKHVEAGKVAMKAYADATDKTVEQIRGAMTPMGQAWDMLTTKVTNFWDAIKKGATFSTKEELIAQNQTEIDKIEKGSILQRVMGDAELTRLKNKNSFLQIQIDAEKSITDEKQKQANFNKWILDNQKYLDKGLTNQQKYDRQSKVISENKGQTPEQTAAALAGLRREIFGEGAQSNAMDIVQKRYNDELKAAQAMNENKIKLNKYSYEVGLVDKATYAAEEERLLGESEKAQLAIIEDYQTKVKGAYATQMAILSAKSGSGSQDVKNLKDKFEELNKSLETTKKRLADTMDERQREAMKAIEIVVKEATDAYKELGKAIDASTQQRSNTYSAERELAGTYGATAEKIKAARDEYNKYTTAIAAADERVRQATVNAENPNLTDESKVKAEEALAKARIFAAQSVASARAAAAQAGNDAEQRYNDMSIKRLNAYNDAFANVFTGMADALVTFAQTGKLSFSGLIDSMLVDLLRFELHAQMSALYSATGGAAGLMNMIMGPGYTVDTGGQGMGSIGSVDTASLAAGSFKANGAAYSAGVEMFAKGGSFTNSVVDSPTLFKFAKGTGMMGEAGPEAIMPLRRGPDGSLGVQSQGNAGANVSVNIINNSSAQATTSETKDSRGNRQIEVVIGDMTASEVQRSGSASQKAMKNTFGVQPQLIRR